MRLQAFGPFAGIEEIDFDELAAGGLHLIHGPTGAGKTSILDAICFALFAGVPGGRTQGRETLRSDHAAPTSHPEVELEFGVAERRLRVRRSPEHQVPKKRGAGTRAQRGSVTLEERRGGGWETISTRADEVAQTVGDLLGMGLAQFAQVMLLPQGEFTAFLRSKPDDRGRLLERLFDISDFAAVEQWLTNHRKKLETHAAQAYTQRTALIARAQELLSEVSQASDADSAGGEGDDHSGGLDDPTESSRVLQEITDDLSARLTASLAESDAASSRVEQLRGRLSAERAVAALQRQAQTAHQVLDRVAAQADQVAEASDRLVLAERAARCSPAVGAVSRRGSAYRAAFSVAAGQREQLARLTGWAVPEARDDSGATDAALRPLVERAAAGTVALAGHVELRRQQQSLQSQLCTAATQLEAAERMAADRRGAIDAAESQRAQLVERRVTLLPRAVARPHWMRLLADLERTGLALDAAITDVDTASSAEQRHRETRRSWTQAEQQVIHLRSARLADIAAELAAELTAGDPCPVCGSAEHPHTAQRAEGHVDADTLSAAEDAAAAALAVADRAAARSSAALGRAQLSCSDAVAALTHIDEASNDDANNDDATVEVDASRTEFLAAVEDSRARANELVTRITTEPPVLDDELADALTGIQDRVRTACETAHHRAADTESAVQQLHVLDTELDAFEAELCAAREGADTAAEAVRRAAGRVESLGEQTDAAAIRIEQVVRDHQESCGCAADPDPVTAHVRCVDQLDQLTTADADLRTSYAELATARDELATLLQETHFADADSVTQAMLSETETQRLKSLVSTAQTDAAKATGVLEQSDVAAADAAPPAEVDVIANELQSAERVARHTHDAVGEIRRALAGLQRIGAELAAHDERSAPLADKLAVAGSVASAVAGSGDNTMRMRLTAYVLAARLESVTTLANERLRLMTDGRYQLEHTDERAARGSKSGLGLRVRDAWTGTTRDTATLSGGESFIASLALALGLGDAVLEAAGGRRLETLLVDEGFGSLDQDSLEQVLDVLDGLRAGGRNVGIVSHVPELRARIPAQIQVCKTAHGSTVRVVTPDLA